MIEVLMLTVGLASVGCGGSGSDVAAACTAAADKLTTCAASLEPAAKAALEAQASSFRSQCDAQGSTSQCASQRTAYYNCLKSQACTAFTTGSNVCPTEAAAVLSCAGAQ